MSGPKIIKLVVQHFPDDRKIRHYFSLDLPCIPQTILQEIKKIPGIKEATTEQIEHINKVCATIHPSYDWGVNCIEDQIAGIFKEFFDSENDSEDKIHIQILPIIFVDQPNNGISIFCSFNCLLEHLF